MIDVSKNVYIDKLNNIVNWDNNTYQRKMKMKPIEVKDNDKDPKLKVGDHVRISKYKTFFAKGYTPNWSKEMFWLKKFEIEFHGHMSLMISMVKKLLERFMKNNNKSKSTRI